MVEFPTDLWIPALTKPGETFSKLKGKASLVDAVIVMAVVGLISGILMGLLAGPVGIIGGAIGGAIGAVIMSLVGVGVVWLIAKLLGGKGEFTQQYYVFTLFWAPITLINGVLGLVPVIGSLVSGLLSLYALYPLTLSIKQVHKLDTLKAVLAWLIPGIVLAIIAVIVGAALAAMLGMAYLAQAGSY